MFSVHLFHVRLSNLCKLSYNNNKYLKRTKLQDTTYFCKTVVCRLLFKISYVIRASQDSGQNNTSQQKQKPTILNMLSRHNCYLLKHMIRTLGKVYEEWGRDHLILL